MNRMKARLLLLSFIKEIPSFIKLMYNLLKDPRVARVDKAIVGAALAYVLLPADLLPDLIPFLGQVDDVYIVVIALQRLLNSAGENIVAQYWQGKPGIIASLQNVVESALCFLPQAVVDKLTKKVY
ncbi:MAG: YkvA family protein [Pelotomaculum sp.]|jgi:uncharacterized membrane protein YkvA (DUF1232 family)